MKRNLYCVVKCLSFSPVGGDIYLKIAEANMVGHEQECANASLQKNEVRRNIVSL